jgi:histidinol-phosphate aminotransferase
VAPTPSYILYQTLAGIQGARLNEVPFEADWTLDPRKLGGVGHLTFVPNPNSPTGTFTDPERFDRWPTPLVLDEAYVDFAPANGLDLVKRNDHIVVTRTLSKSYALAGLRFGYAVACSSLADQLYKVKDSYNCDVLALAAATAAVQDQEYLDQTRRKILSTRRRLDTALQGLGFQTLPSQANFVWCQHARRAAQRIYESLKQHGILIRYFDYPNWGSGLRISVGTDEEIEQLLDQLRGIV